jgi:hypothetical protein
MKYELIETTYGKEPQIIETIVDKGEATDVITDEYSVEITLTIKDTESLADVFTKKIIVTSHNKQTGYEVDAQREEAINAFMKSIN